MSVIEIVSGPLIGAIIGYGTNYIAVKMLFRPLKPIRVFGHTLPYTPGVIPKRKSQLGKAVGDAIGNSLLTKEDMEKLFLSEEIKNTAIDEICKLIFDTLSKNQSIKEIITNRMETEDYENRREKLQSFLGDKIVDGLSKLDIGTMIAKEGGRAIKEKTLGSMISMFLNDDMITSIATPIGKKVADYIEENGRNMLNPIIGEEMNQLENKSINDILSQMNMKEERIREIVTNIYQEFVQTNIGKIIGKFNVSNIVEEKIEAMDVMEMEHLVLSVMKNELTTIVNLGAIIGLLIGLLNLLF